MTDVVSLIASSGGDYSSPIAWEADLGGATSADFVGNTEVVIGELADELHSIAGSLTINGATTNTTYKWVLRAVSGAEVKGRIAAGARLVNTATGNLLLIRDDAEINDIHLMGSASATTGVVYSQPFEGISAIIDRCIISSQAATNSSVYGVLCGNQAAGSTSIRNSLIIDLGGFGLTAEGTGPVVSMSNCVVANTNLSNNAFRGGINTDRSNITLTNVACYNNLNADFYGSASATALDIASSDGTAYGTGAVTGLTSAAFADAANDDYHLSGSGSVLYDAGADMSGTFTLDMDGDTWVNWSIGFDQIAAAGTTISITDSATTAETLAGAISLALADSASGNDASPAATVTFNLSDVGNASDVLNLLALITQTDSASGSDANPSAAVTLLQTDIGNAADVLNLLALITQTDTATGAEVLTVVNTVTDVISTIGTGGDYPTIAAWISAKAGNLVSANQRQIGVLKNQVFAETLTFSGWTCDATHYPMLMAETGAEFDHVTETGAWIKPGVNSGITLQNNLHLHIRDIGIGTTSHNTPLIKAPATTGAHMFDELRRCSIYTSGTLGGFDTVNAGGRHLKNCLIKIASGTSFTGGVHAFDMTNCTLIGGETGGYLALYGALNNTVIYNNLSHTDPLIFDCTGDYNAASDTSAPGANSIDSITSAEFENFAGGNYHLAASSQLIGAGTNLTGTIDTDIDGQSWPGSGAWDIGMDFYVAPGTNDVTITDSATISEALASSISLILSDSASGSDANPAATVTFNVIDSGNAADVLGLLALVTAADIASGADALAIANQLTVADTALGADAHTLVVSFALTDSGSASDSIALITETLKTINDLAAANDAIAAMQVSVPVADAATGLDAHSVLVSLAIADSAAGADAVTTLQTLLKQINDAALGSDQVGPLTVQVQVPDASTAVDSLSRLTALFQVLDDAGALDTVVTFDSVTRIAEIRFTLSKRRLAFAMTARSMTFTLH